MNKKETEINKRAERHVAFMYRFTPQFYVTVKQVRGLIRGLIDDHESHPAFNLHHRINSKAERQAGRATLEIIYIKNERL